MTMTAIRIILFTCAILSATPLTGSSADDADKAKKVVDACKKHFKEHASTCSGFVRAVASDFGLKFGGAHANATVGELGKAGSGWTSLGLDGKLAKQKADAGCVVLAGLPGSEMNEPDAHGHVVVVVTGPLAHDKYSSAYCGKLNGVGKENTTLNYARLKAAQGRSR